MKYSNLLLANLLKDKNNQYFCTEDDIDLAYQCAVQHELLRLTISIYNENHCLPSDNIWFLWEDRKGNKFRITDAYSAARLAYVIPFLDVFNVSMHHDNRKIELHHPVELLGLIRYLLERSYQQEVCQIGWEKLCKISEEAIISATMSLAWQNKRYHEIKKSADCGSNFWVHLFSDKDFDSVSIFNCYTAYRGRIIMPFSKMRIPFNPVESLSYSPEFDQTILLEVAAIKVDWVYINNTILDGSYVEFFAQEYPVVYEQWENALQKMNIDVNDYIPWPIHPMSVDLIKNALKSLVLNHELIFLENTTLPTKASLSYRTMIPFGEAALIKLPIPLQLTGSIRSIPVCEIEQAPQLGNQIKIFIELSHHFDNTLYLSPEVTGLYVKTSNAEIEEFLTVMFRNNPRKSLAANEIYMPLAGLFIPSPCSNKPLLVDLLKANKCDVLLYFKDYISTVLKGILGLYLVYGVMLEAHQQNLGLIFCKEGRLIRMLYHDIVNSALIFKPLFLAMGGDPLVLENVLYAEDTTNRSIGQLVHTLLWDNLFPIHYILSNEFEIDESIFIDMIYDAFQNQFDEARAQHDGQLSPEVNTLRNKLISEVEAALLLSSTTVSKRLLGKIYLQSQTKNWGTVPNRSTEFETVKADFVTAPNILYNKFRCEVVNN